MDKLWTEEDLLQHFLDNRAPDWANVDVSEIKYALYARKSTQGDEQAFLGQNTTSEDG